MDYNPIASPTNVLNLQLREDLGKISCLLPYKSSANRLLGKVLPHAMLQIWCAQKEFKQKAHALAILCTVEFSLLKMDSWHSLMNYMGAGPEAILCYYW